jgi:hypothetical protein
MKLLSKNKAVATDQFPGKARENRIPLELVKLLFISPNFLKSVLKDVEKDARKLTLDFLTTSFFSGSTFMDDPYAVMVKIEAVSKM